MACPKPWSKLGLGGSKKLAKILIKSCLRGSKYACYYDFGHFSLRAARAGKKWARFEQAYLDPLRQDLTKILASLFDPLDQVLTKVLASHFGPQDLTKVLGKPFWTPSTKI